MLEWVGRVGRLGNVARQDGQVFFCVGENKTVQVLDACVCW